MVSTMDNQSMQKRNHRRGATTVEFALTAPILFMLLLGAIEFSRANMLRHTTVVAATEGARRGIVPGATAKECHEETTNELKVVGFPDTDVQITPSVFSDDTTQVTVSVSVPLSLENGFVLPNFLKGAIIEKSVTLQRELAVEVPDTEIVERRASAGNDFAAGGEGGKKGKKGRKGDGDDDDDD